MKELFYDLDAETNIIGSILKNNNGFLDITSIKAEDFYNKANQIIFKAIQNMFNKNIPIDIITLKNGMDKESLKSIGGITYITSVQESVISSRNVKYYAKIVKEKSNKRHIFNTCRQALKNIQEEMELDDVVNSLQNDLLCINEVKSSNMKTDEEIMTSTLDLIQKNYENGGGITGMSTKLKSLDMAMNGLNKGQFTIIAARPGMGKTCFTLNLADNLAEKYKGLFFSLEMVAEKLGIRRLAFNAYIDSTKILKGKMTSVEWDNLVKASGKIANSKLITDDSVGVTIQDIKFKAKRIKMQQGLDFIVIDHIGLLQSTIKTDNRLRQVEEITRQLKIMSKELDIHVIGLSQLSRAPEQRQDHRPILSDLRDSGSIEQDADNIIFLYRDEYYDRETEDKNIIEAIIAKQREGNTGILKYGYSPEFQMIAELYRG